MTDDMLRWAQDSPGVGEVAKVDLLGEAQIPLATPIDPRSKPVRHRPNKGRIKRTNRNPPLVEPPWELLRETGCAVPPDLVCLNTTPSNWRRGPKYRVWRREVHAMHGYTCHLCGHEDAYTADHLVPLSVWPNQPYDARIARPAHGIDGCPICHVKCNTSRSNRLLAREIKNYRPPIAL